MTGVEFHFNAPDKVGYACRLLRKAVGKGARLVVTGEPALLRELDTALWTFSPLEFVPHCYGDTSGAAVLAASPVVLSQAPHAAPHHEVLVNLGPAVPEGFERFERLIEVVTADDDDRVQGRRRWKHYADRGYAILKHDRGEEAA
jgi:DNA polymerase III subunit chi